MSCVNMSASHALKYDTLTFINYSHHIHIIISNATLKFTYLTFLVEP